MAATNASAERVTFVTDEQNPDRFLPQVLKGLEGRAFEPEDMPRVLDFEGAIEAPPDGSIMFDVAGEKEPTFPVYHFCLRGGFLFYFNVADVDGESGPYVTYHNSPVGVVPLQGVQVDYPPGGRRVFREHSHTDAKSGYELVILHSPTDGEQPRPPSFLVADSLGKREKWAQALRSRAESTKPTLMRAGYSSSTTRKVAPVAASGAGATAAIAGAAPATKTSIRAEKKPLESADGAKTNRKGSITRSAKDSKSIQQQVMEESDDAELASAVVEFGVAEFDEKAWMTDYYQMNNADDATAKCDQMDKWQTEMKRELKGAVLEQYEYFVQASGEMTTMGHEVSMLKSLIEKQAETLKEMKTIDFLGAAKETGRDEIMGRSEDEVDSADIDLDAAVSSRGKDERSFFSEMSSIEGGSVRRSQSVDQDIENDDAPPIEIPDWLDDVTEEISAIVRECRYSDAIELHTKARTEIGDILDKHERPTAYRLTSKQKDSLKSSLKELNALGDRISGRIEESLRRKNEALRQTFKRERADLNAMMTPSISPCALNDDELYLQLLVKMGRNKEAAEAYSQRRSLLLLETLNERPISGAGTVDLVIYAAQLSQSFFSCLASSVEGFLDLFLSPPPTMNGDKAEAEDVSLDASSLHSHSSKNLPAGAVASVVLWCDSELTKFANAFGGARVLSNLALTPPPRDTPKQPRVVGGGPADDILKERKNALEVAAQCIDQAFMYASRNLDAVGLPLTPRLAECIRMRLKGCEAEVSLLLDDRWQHLTSEWRTSGDEHAGNGHIR
jgi:hypothetical protein